MKNLAIQQKQFGYILIEGLVAMLVVSIGVLGLVALQGNLHSRNLDATQRIQATLLGNELITMAVADSDNAACYVLPISSQNGCTSDIARNYTEAWLNDTYNHLQGSSTQPPVATLGLDNTFTVNVAWQRKGQSAMSNYTAVTQIGN